MVIRRKTTSYRVVGNRLMADDEELLQGALAPLEHFARALTLIKPNDEDIAPLLRILIRTTTDFSYACGPRLLNDGTPLRLIQPQKRPKPKVTPRKALEASE